MSYKCWLSNLTEKVRMIHKTAAREDLSLPVLENLLSQGYNEVEWDSGRSTHSKCVELNGQRWKLEDFLTGLEHSAPIAEKSHPNDSSCTLLIRGPDLPDVRVDYDGNTY